MSILSKAKSADPSSPLIITLLGEPGSGKTATACTFPRCFMIRTQGESVPRDLEKHGIQLPDILGDTPSGETTTEASLMAQLTALLRDEHDYSTVIIDSVTGLEAMFIAEILANPSEKASSIVQACGGYGAGRDVVASKHNRVRKAAEMLRTKRGINVIFLAHTDVTRMELPDQEAYTKYALQLHSKSQAPYVSEVDVVAQVKLQTALIGEGRKRAIGSGERVLLCTMSPSSVTKNRLGITEELPMELGKNPFAAFIGKPRKARPQVKRADPAPETEPTEEFTAEDFVEGEVA